MRHLFSFSNRSVNKFNLILLTSVYIFINSCTGAIQKKYGKKKLKKYINKTNFSYKTDNNENIRKRLIKSLENMDGIDSMADGEIINTKKKNLNCNFNTKEIDKFHILNKLKTIEIKALRDELQTFCLKQEQIKLLLNIYKKNKFDYKNFKEEIIAAKSYKDTTILGEIDDDEKESVFNILKNKLDPKIYKIIKNINFENEVSSRVKNDLINILKYLNYTKFDELYDDLEDITFSSIMDLLDEEQDENGQKKYKKKDKEFIYKKLKQVFIYKEQDVKNNDKKLGKNKNNNKIIQKEREKYKGVKRKKIENKEKTERKHPKIIENQAPQILNKIDKPKILIPGFSRESIKRDIPNDIVNLIILYMPGFFGLFDKDYENSTIDHISIVMCKLIPQSWIFIKDIIDYFYYFNYQGQYQANFLEKPKILCYKNFAEKKISFDEFYQFYIKIKCTKFGKLKLLENIYTTYSEKFLKRILDNLGIKYRYDDENYIEFVNLSENNLENKLEQKFSNIEELAKFKRTIILLALNPQVYKIEQILQKYIYKKLQKSRLKSIPKELDFNMMKFLTWDILKQLGISGSAYNSLVYLTHPHRLCKEWKTHEYQYINLNKDLYLIHCFIFIYYKEIDKQGPMKYKEMQLLKNLDIIKFYKSKELQNINYMRQVLKYLSIFQSTKGHNLDLNHQYIKAFNNVYSKYIIFLEDYKILPSFYHINLCTQNSIETQNLALLYETAINLKIIISLFKMCDYTLISNDKLKNEKKVLDKLLSLKISPNAKILKKTYTQDYIKKLLTVESNIRETDSSSDDDSSI